SVDIVGPSNLVTFLEHTSGYRQDLRRVEYGDERDPKVRAYLESIAPANKAKNITKPLFVIAGKNDPRVPASESEQMAEVVRKNNTPVWYLLAKDEGHGFHKKKNRDFQFRFGREDSQRTVSVITTHHIHSEIPSSLMRSSDLTPAIISAAINIHRRLGPGLLESAYEACIAHELQLAGMRVERQKPVPL